MFWSIELSPEKVDCIVLSACALHNWLRRTSAHHYRPPGCADNKDIEDIDTGAIAPGSWRNDVPNNLFLERCWGINNLSRQATAHCEEYAEFFMKDGAVDWQWNKM